MRSKRMNFLDNVFNTYNTESAKMFFDHSVVGQWDVLAFNLRAHGKQMEEGCNYWDKSKKFAKQQQNQWMGLSIPITPPHIKYKNVV
jgi:hypothetical protein